MHNHSHIEDHKHEHHSHTVYGELMEHFPLAVFSVAFGLALISLIGAQSIGQEANLKLIKKSAHILFHSFHFMHIVFAATGTVITFMRFSNSVFRAIVVGLICPTIFCMLSDAVLPYLAGCLLGVHMHFHLCFYSELANVLPFLFVGVITGLVMSANAKGTSTYAATSHVAHIFVSSLASTFYLVAHGFSHWYDHIGLVFLSLIVAVVIPCTLSDLVVPMTFAKAGRGNEKHKA